MKAKPLRFAILARVSTKPQEKGESLDVQEQRGREYVARLGGSVAQVYRGVESATKAHEDRALLQRIIHDAQAGRFDALWVLDKSRLSRSPGTTERIAAVFGALGVALHTAQGVVDLGSSEGEFLAIIEAAADRLTSRRTRERTRQGREKLLGEGKHAFGRWPWGRWWDKPTGKWIVDEPQRKTLQRAWQLYVRGGHSLERTAELVGVKKSTLRMAVRTAGDESPRTLAGKRYVLKVPPLLSPAQIAAWDSKAAKNSTTLPR